MKFIFHYRHQVGHRHQLTIIVDPLKTPTFSAPSPEWHAREEAQRVIENIFQPEYLKGLYLIEVKEEQHGRTDQ